MNPAPGGVGREPGAGDGIRVLELRSTSGQGGGPERALLYAAASAGRHGVEETLCFLQRRGDAAPWVHARALELGAPSHVVEERRAIDLRTLVRLRGVVRDRRIQIVHGHDYKADLLAFLLARLERITPAATAHGWPERTRRERLLYYPADRRLLVSFPLVFAVAPDLRDRLLAAGAPPEALELLPNAVDVDVFRPDEGARARVRREWGVGADEQVVGTVGRLDREKRPDLLLEAFAAIAAVRPRARLVAAGDGPLRPRLLEWAAHRGLAARCLVLGHRLDAEEVHRGFDVFVQASETEGSPYSLLEALASETPVVATAVGDTADLVRDGIEALLVPPGDAPALARALAAVLDGPEAARERARAARRRVCAERSLAARQARVAERYRALVGARARLARPGGVV